jgi:hypothetical protein
MMASQIFARRIGRATFGIVLLFGVAHLVAALGWGWSDDVSAARIIVLTWLCAGLAGVLARAVAVWLVPPQRPDRLFAKSLMLMTAGIALLLPISLHMPFALLTTDREGFNAWVVMSMAITGLAHVVFAITSVLRAFQLATGKRAWSPRRIYVATVLTSCVPFIVLLAIPPMLVALTALPCVPLLYAMERIVTRERAEIARLPQPLPRAVAVSRRSS